MKNKDLIIKIARRLDKFSLDEIITISEFQEQDVKDILSDLLKSQVIIKNNDTYFFNPKKISKTYNYTPPAISSFKPIIIEEEDGYEELLKFGEETQNKVKRYAELLNFVHQAGTKNLRQVVDLFNETSGYKKIPYPTFTRILSNYNKYGFRGIFPNYHNSSENSIPEEIYTCFKKYYLTKEKLSASEALYRTQKQLQSEQKIEQPYAYNANAFLRKIKTEFTKEQIKYFRNNINPPKVKIYSMKAEEPLNMEFKKAANIYLTRLRLENKLERFIHEKTDYKNHLQAHFDNLTIREITTRTVSKYKQYMFDNGFQLASVNMYIALLKRIIRAVCPKTNSLVTRGDKIIQNVYALDMNILSEDEITYLLQICQLKYPAAYPVLYLSLSTGASVPELLGLTWDRINFEDNTIFLKYFLYEQRLVVNKGGIAARTLKIDNKISGILQKKLKKTKPAPSDFVFKFNSPKSPQQYFEGVVLRGLSIQLGIQRLFPSDLQHNFANLCLKQNIPVTFIQKSLGYYSLANFVKIYKNLIGNQEKEYYNPLDKIYSKTGLENAEK